MAVLRVVSYPRIDGDPDNAYELWERTVGSFLKDRECRRATLAIDDSRMVVATEWTSMEALDSTLSSAEYEGVMSRLMAELGMSSSDVAEPSFLFQGAIEAAV